MDSTAEKLLTTDELGQVLGVSRQTISKAVASGKVPHIRLNARVIRFRLDDVLRALGREATGATS